MELLIERSLLEDLGFERCRNTSGWDHEVWYHKIDFWVHFFEDSDSNSQKMYHHEANAFITSRSEFLRKFLFEFENHIIDASYIHYTRLF